VNRRDFLKRIPSTIAVLSAIPMEAFPFQGTLSRKDGAARKIVIIGAGLAGLSAAYELTEAGHDVTVLEAQQRPGGRVRTLRDSLPDGLYVDAGATRIPNHHHFTLKYAELFGLTLVPFQPSDLSTIYYVRNQRLKALPGENVEWPYELTPEERSLGLNGIRQKYIWSMLNEIGDVTDPNWPSPEILKKYDQMNRSDFWRSRGASEEAVALLSLGGINDRIENWSTLFMLRNQALNRKLDTYYKIRGGTDLLPRAFAQKLAEQIQYGAPVVRIEQDAQSVKAIFLRRGTHHTIIGDFLICAVPFSVQKNIEVVPPFSVEKQRAIEQLPYLSASKIFLQTKERFWLNQGESGFAITDFPIGQVWDITHNQPGKRGILQAFPISLHSRRVTEMSEAERITFALDQMEKIFPGVQNHFEAGLSKCWDQDEWARGASAYYKPGQFSTLLPHVSRPEGRIHFAGEHTSVWIDGWMQGALESGNRVANEVNTAAAIKATA
jgi:monoamine oxidase